MSIALATIDLGVGAPDIATPRVAAEAAIEAIESGKTTYAGAAGILSLRERVAERFAVDKGFLVTPDQVVASAGAKLTVFCVLMALARPGGNVVFAAPHYGGYPHLIRMAGLEGRVVPTRVEDGYRIDPELLAQALDDDTVAVILNLPSNPTGAVASDDELAALVDVVVQRSGAVIVSDEIYAAFTYDGPISSPSRFAPADRVVVIDGVSKAYGMSGWRIGYAAGPQEIIARARIVNNRLSNCASSISQHAAAAALTLAPWETADVDRHRHLRDLAHRLAGDIRGAAAVKPRGGIYQSIQLDEATIAALGAGGETVADAIFRRSGIRLPQDSAFGTPGLLRVTFSLPEPVLIEGMQRLAETFNEL